MALHNTVQSMARRVLRTPYPGRKAHLPQSNKRESRLNWDDLRTVLLETEAVLNSRPLTHVGAEFDMEKVIRPADFLQEGVILSYPMAASQCDGENGIFNYSAMPKEAVALNTKRQATAALKATLETSEKLWHRFQREYWTSLRERHKMLLEQGRTKNIVPRVGQLVLVTDEILPRHHWKLARIDTIVPNARGDPCELKLKIKGGDLIRRSVNLVVPLELEDDIHELPETKGNGPRGPNV
ncbi:hypothetical protein L596_022587 [Steinernema carpocapsae]|uniref:DUF5641 domain-containing protein n=1 Tax=Steinernema carpocapsae TaxID=34508 RepID=A0A4U5MMJ6_STECR|nr:hypothetical protein L596_022587 [Steinernema carpocapsae]